MNSSKHYVAMYVAMYIYINDNVIYRLLTPGSICQLNSCSFLQTKLIMSNCKLQLLIISLVCRKPSLFQSLVTVYCSLASTVIYHYPCCCKYKIAVCNFIFATTRIMVDHRRCQATVNSNQGLEQAQGSRNIP